MFHHVKLIDQIVDIFRWMFHNVIVVQHNNEWIRKEEISAWWVPHTIVGACLLLAINSHVFHIQWERRHCSEKHKNTITLFLYSSLFSAFNSKFYFITIYAFLFFSSHKLTKVIYLLSSLRPFHFDSSLFLQKNEFYFYWMILLYVIICSTVLFLSDL